jgi:CheY-like chemotaxis protein
MLGRRLTVPHAANPVHVLVVDDDRDAADGLAALLSASGHHASARYDGEGALGACRRRMPDVVLLDLGMPGVDGLSVAARIREMKGGDRVRLIAVTGWIRKRDVDAALAAGFDHYLTKPTSLESMEAMLAPRDPAKPDDLAHPDGPARA